MYVFNSCLCILLFILLFGYSTFDTRFVECLKKTKKIPFLLFCLAKGAIPFKAFLNPVLDFDNILYIPFELCQVKKIKHKKLYREKIHILTLIYKKNY